MGEDEEDDGHAGGDGGGWLNHETPQRTKAGSNDSEGGVCARVCVRACSW